MIGDTVAIEVPDAVSERDEGRTIGACEAALGDDSCSRVEEGLTTDFTARVTQPSPSELTIELILAGQQEVASVRVLRFTEDEPEAFRWQSVGVVVAALVLSQNRPEESPEPAEEVSEPPERSSDSSPAPVETPPAPRPPTAREEVAVREDIVTLDVAGLVASGAAGAGVGGGAWLGGGLRLSGPLHLLVQGDATWSATEDGHVELRATALGASAGFGLRGALAHPAFGWELSARGAMQWLGVRAASEAESGVASTTRWGARTGLSLTYRPFSFWGVVVGADAGMLWPPVEVEVGEPEPTQISALFWGAYLGLRMRLNRL